MRPHRRENLPRKRQSRLRGRAISSGFRAMQCPNYWFFKVLAERGYVYRWT